MDAYDLASKLIFLAWFLGIYNFGLLAGAKIFIPGRYRYDFVTGLGPRIGSFSIGTTHFELRLIPFLSAIRYYGDDPSIWRGMACLLSGPIAMFLAGVLTVVMILLTGVPVQSRSGAQITDVTAAQVGLREDDIVVEANGRRIADGADLARELSNRQVARHVLRVERGGSEIQVVIDPPSGAAKERELWFRSPTRMESAGPGKVVAMVPKTSWDSLVFKSRHVFNKNEGVWINLGTAHRCAIDVAGDLFNLGLIVLALSVAVSIGHAGVRMMEKLQNRGEKAPRLRTAVEWGVVVVCTVLFITGTKAYSRHHAVSIFDSPTALSTVRRLPVNVYWGVRI